MQYGEQSDITVVDDNFKTAVNKGKFLENDIGLRAFPAVKCFGWPLRLSAKWAQLLWNPEFGCADEKEFLKIIPSIITG